MMTFKSNNEKGSVLVMAVVLSFTIFVMGLSFLAGVDNFEKSVTNEVAKTQNVFISHLANRLENANVQNGGHYSNSFGNWVEAYENNWYRSKVIFGQTLEDDLFYGSARGYRVIGAGRTELYGSDNVYEGTIATMEILQTFADYLYLSDREVDTVRREPIFFWTPDTLDGKVHSNDTLHISGSPRFMKKVTSSAPVTFPPYNNATYDEGLELSAPEIFFPDQADEIRRYTYRRNFGTFAPDSMDSSTELTFNGRDIHVRYCGPDPTIPGRTRCLPQFISDPREKIRVPDAVGALFVHGKVFIKADRYGHDWMDDTLSTWTSLGFEGRLTVASSDTMIIPDNLVYRYANPDNSIPTEIEDCLGLISENFIMIGDSVDQVVYINAAMAAINGSISVRDIYDYGYTIPNDNEKQSLFIYGSLAQRNRGLVHTSYNGWGERGFIEKDYHYDTRLQQYPPPHFIPTGNHKSIYTEGFYSDG